MNSKNFMLSFFRKICHSFLIIFIAIIFSYFFFFLFLHPLNLVYFLGDKLYAATGIGSSATVPQNPINQLALQLDDKQKELDARERALNDRAQTLNEQSNFWNNGLLVAIFFFLIVLGILVMINFYYDRRREKELEILAEHDKEERTLEEEGKNNDN
jgi:hypothetical protein